MAKLGKNSVSISDQTKAFPYLLEVLGLSLPIIFGNIGQIFIGTTETFVSGKHSGTHFSCHRAFSSGHIPFF